MSDIIFLNSDNKVEYEISGICLACPEDSPSRPLGCKFETYSNRNDICVQNEFGQPVPRPSVLSRAPIFHITEEEISWLHCAVNRFESEINFVNCELMGIMQGLMLDEVESDSVSKEICKAMVHSNSIYDDLLQGHGKHVRNQLETRRLYRQCLQDENLELRARLQAQEKEMREREALQAALQSRDITVHALKAEIASLQQQLEQERDASVHFVFNPLLSFWLLSRSLDCAIAFSARRHTNALDSAGQGARAAHDVELQAASRRRDAALRNAATARAAHLRAAAAAAALRAAAVASEQQALSAAAAAMRDGVAVLCGDAIAALRGGVAGAAASMERELHAVLARCAAAHGGGLSRSHCVLEEAHGRADWAAGLICSRCWMRGGGLHPPAASGHVRMGQPKGQRGAPGGQHQGVHGL